MKNINKLNNLNIFFSKKFSKISKPETDFYDFIINNMNKNSKTNETNENSRLNSKFETNKEQTNTFFKEKNYFKLKDKVLSPRIKQDIVLLKLKEEFTTNELRQKFLALAKLYHPDLRKSDKKVKI